MLPEMTRGSDLVGVEVGMERSRCGLGCVSDGSCRIPHSLTGGCRGEGQRGRNVFGACARGAPASFPHRLAS